MSFMERNVLEITHTVYVIYIYICICLMIHGFSEKHLTCVNHTQNSQGFTSHSPALSVKQQGVVEIALPRETQRPMCRPSHSFTLWPNDNTFTPMNIRFQISKMGNLLLSLLSHLDNKIFKCGYNCVDMFYFVRYYTHLRLSNYINFSILPFMSL